MAIMFENTAMITVFGHKKSQVIGSWRKIHNDDIYNFPSLNITRAMKIRRMCIPDAMGM